MTTSIGAPFIPPDDTLLNVSSTGKLQLKPGTQGDILYAGASGVWATLPAGASGEVLQANGATDPSWETLALGEAWTFIEKLSPSGAAISTTSGTLPVYDYYLIKAKLTTTGNPIGLRINGDATAAHYTARYQSAATTWAETADTHLYLGTAGTTNETFIADVVVMGKSRAVAGGTLPVFVNAAGGNVAQGGTIAGYWGFAGNATQVTSLSLRPNTGTITGTIEVFGRNIHA